ncbi:hypothetical protein SPSYN_00315 [Sporotomaculum syntrophicum]|uniref:Uncharacterized protein n=1 Tax=Sporotomaculum syntrophicum TaxID=182264 RepID=A0A9D2WTD7_9FIRM|nr:DUF1292 domain-containing protein [Sporotomaculum syntrophicum]KAF1086596.1 hypothetical protein SPSYN_00315 [Sporotomaculum syntrophicum]
MIILPDQDEIITIIDEDNNEHDVIIYDILELEGKRYAIVVPLVDEDDEEPEDLDFEDFDDESEGDAFVLKIEQDEYGGDILVEVDDDEWEKIKDACMEVLESNGNEV